MHRCRSSQGEVRTEQNSQLTHLLVIPVQYRLGKPELRDTIAKDTADLLTYLEYRHLIPSAGHQNRDSNTRRSRAYYTDTPAIPWLSLQHHLIKTCIGNIIFNRGNVYRFPFNSLHTMPFTLLLMIAYQRTDHRQRIVCKDHLRRLSHLPGQEHLDHSRDRSIDRTSLPASRLLTVQTSLSFIDRM